MDNYLANTISQTASQTKVFTACQGGNCTKPGQTPEDIAKTAKSFESLFVGQMLNLLFEGVSADPLFGDKASDNIYRSMLLDQYGKKIADGHSLGIADQVQAELLKLQEVKNDAQ